MMRRLLPLLLVLALLVGCAPADSTQEQVSPSPQVSPSATSEPTAAPSPTATPTPEPTPTSTPEPDAEPEPTSITSTLAVAGDIMGHYSVLSDAYDWKTGQYDFTQMLRYAKPWVEQADLAVTNLETTFAGGSKYTGFPAFNSPDSLGQALKDTGFDLISTTNNHALDKGFAGLSRTLDVLDELGLDHVGTYRTQEEREENHGITVADCGGISIAFLAYSYGTNGKVVPYGKDWCINLFNTDYLSGLKKPDTELLEADMAAARALGCDLIAVIMHWGIEYKSSPNSYQKKMAQTMVDLGADLVLGGHPHVLQPYEFVTTSAGNSGFVCYSMGNFLANQDFLNTDSSALLNLELRKDLTTGETTVAEVSYVPYYLLNPGQYYLNRPVFAIDVYAGMKEYESGDKSLISDTVYQKLKNTLAVCHNVLGAEGDLQWDGTPLPEPETPPPMKPTATPEPEPTPSDQEPVPTDPITGEPLPIEPGTEEPLPTDPVTGEPLPSEPGTEEPVPTDPVTGEPLPSEPGTEEPVPTDPVTGEPLPSEPGTEEPVPSEPGTKEPIPSEPDTEEPIPSVPGIGEPEPEEPAIEAPEPDLPETEEPVPSEPGADEPPPAEPTPQVSAPLENEPAEI